AEDIMLLLGRDNDLDADWENGVFMDNFRGVWGSIDDYLVYMEIVYEGEDYNTYSVPILLNGEEYNLRVVYDYNDEQFYILGARKGLDDTGMADKNLIQLRPGDEITTIHYASTISGDDDFAAVPVDTFTVTEETAFYETDMGDGEFMMMFELTDARNETAWSQPVFFTVEGDDIYTTVYE
ncbi:MAG: clostripain, partial [Clostridia bacterium]|nr:clostripain [Clostridia bacterium]